MKQHTKINLPKISKDFFKLFSCTSSFNCQNVTNTTSTFITTILSCKECFQLKTHIIMNYYYYYSYGGGKEGPVSLFLTRLSYCFCSHILLCTTSGTLQSEMKEDFIVCVVTSSVYAYGRFGRRGRIMHKRQRKQHDTTSYLTGYTVNKWPRGL
jgi:hypothetical protein